MDFLKIVFVKKSKAKKIKKEFEALQKKFSEVPKNEDYIILEFGKEGKNYVFTIEKKETEV